MVPRNEFRRMEAKKMQKRTCNYIKKDIEQRKKLQKGQRRLRLCLHGGYAINNFLD